MTEGLILQEIALSGVYWIKPSCHTSCSYSNLSFYPPAQKTFTLQGNVRTFEHGSAVIYQSFFFCRSEMKMEHCIRQTYWAIKLNEWQLWLSGPGFKKFWNFHHRNRSMILRTRNNTAWCSRDNEIIKDCNLQLYAFVGVKVKRERQICYLCVAISRDM